LSWVFIKKINVNKRLILKEIIKYFESTKKKQKVEDSFKVNYILTLIFIIMNTKDNY